LSAKCCFHRRGVSCAAAIGISKGAVTNYVQRAVQKGLGWPLPADLDEGQLEGLLFRQNVPREHYAAPDYAHVHQEIKRKGVTLQLLWEEYSAAHGERAYRYSQYCERYHRYRGSLARSMRQVHRAGEKLFIDYSGDTAAIIDMATGEVRAAQIFVQRQKLRVFGSRIEASLGAFFGAGPGELLLGLRLSDRLLSLEMDSMRTMQNAVQDGVRQSRIAHGCSRGL
jgi:hypothetical protein